MNGPSILPKLFLLKAFFSSSSFSSGVWRSLVVVLCSCSVGSVLQCVGVMQKMIILQNNDGRCMLNICSIPIYIYMPISSVKYQMMSNHLGAGKPYGRWRITTGNTKQTLFSCQGPKLIWQRCRLFTEELWSSPRQMNITTRARDKPKGSPGQQW